MIPTFGKWYWLIALMVNLIIKISHFSISEIRVRLLSELKSMKPSDRALISLFISIFPSTITSHVYKIYWYNWCVFFVCIFTAPFPGRSISWVTDMFTLVSGLYCLSFPWQSDQAPSCFMQNLVLSQVPVPASQTTTIRRECLPYQIWTTEYRATHATPIYFLEEVVSFN